MSFRIIKLLILVTLLIFLGLDFLNMISLENYGIKIIIAVFLIIFIENNYKKIFKNEKNR